MGSSKRATVGYRYYMGLHFGVCHGPVDSVNNITVGERNAWTGEQTVSGAVTVNAPELFGGDSREGGVAGTLDVMMGEPAQAQNSYLASLLGAGIPAFRGILSAVWRGGQVSANNPYVKPWAFRVFRVLKGWANDVCWYPEKAKIGGYVELPVGGWDIEKVTGNNWEQVDITDNARWIAAGGTSVIVSTDHGDTWSAAIATGAPAILKSICWVAENTYVAGGTSGYAARSTDGGLTWPTFTSITNAYASITFIVKFGTDNVLAVGALGKPAVSADNGATWTAYVTVLDNAQVYAVLPIGSGVIIGGSSGRWASWTGGAYGWSSWTGSNYSGYGIALGGNSILALVNVGGAAFAGGANGAFGSISGGYQTLLGGVNINAASANGQTVIVVGQDGRLQRSTDGGVTFESYVTLFTVGRHITECEYSNGSWCVAGLFGVGAISTDDGATWITYTGIVSTNTVYDIAENSGTWAAVGANGWTGILPLQIYPPTGDMNPAHIVYQCLTDTSWGMGYPTGSIDSTSFTAAADALHAESFGLSMLWNKQETIEAFIQVVLDHIGGMLYVKPDTGAFALKLIRNDYDRGTLPQYGPTNLVSADDYQRQAWGETINEITVVYTDANSGKEVSVTVQDTANIMAQSGVISQTRSYAGIRQPSLAQRVALRDLEAASTPLARIKLTATRAAWAVFPGDVFRLTWDEYGISDVVFRALGVNRGTLQDGQIIVDAVEDVFGLPENTYLVDQPSEWEDPSNEPAPAPFRAMIETPYWDLVRNLSAADMAYVDSLSCYLETLAVRPSNDAINYTIYTRVGSADYAERGNGDFCPSATIVGALTKTTTAITLTNGVDLDLVVAGGYAVIESEYVLVSAIDAVAGTATISRGVLDTVPADHVASSRIWFADGYQGFETTEYADTETVDVKMLPVTGQGELPIADAPVNSLTFDQRQYRPYSPGKFLINTAIYPAFIAGTGDLSLSWAHRDRLLQTAYIVEQSEASIGPEAGTTYSVRIYDAADALLQNTTGISGTSHTYTSTEGVFRIELESVRSALASHQKHNHTVRRTGYGYNYGMYYG